METIKKTGKKLAGSQKVRFGLVGIINTLVDFSVLNLLVDAFHLAVIPANIISTTVAMLVSFGLNKKAVFRSEGGGVRQVILFFAVTLMSIWVVQTGVIALVYPLFDNAPGVVRLNVAKLLGIMAGLIWNYLWYSRVVFGGGTKTDEKVG